MPGHGPGPGACVPLRGTPAFQSESERPRRSSAQRCAGTNRLWRLDPEQVSKIVESEALSVATIVPLPDDTLGGIADEVDREEASPLPLPEEDRLAEETSEGSKSTPALEASDAPQTAPASALEQALDKADWRPKHLVRTVVSSLCDAQTFGTQMKREATDRRFFEARLQAFLGDGLPWNWSIWKKHIPTFTPSRGSENKSTARLHPSAVVSLHSGQGRPSGLKCGCVGPQYQVWMTGCWRGEVSQVKSSQSFTAGKSASGNLRKSPPRLTPASS